MPLAHWLVCAPVQVMFLPQKPVAAPGKTLLEQLIYPAVMPEEGTALDSQHLAHLLQQVGLTDLLQRVQGNWHLSQNWQGRNLLFMLGCHGAPHAPQRVLSRHGPCLVESGHGIQSSCLDDMHVCRWSVCVEQKVCWGRFQAEKFIICCMPGSNVSDGYSSEVLCRDCCTVSKGIVQTQSFVSTRMLAASTTVAPFSSCSHDLFSKVIHSFSATVSVA